MKVILPIALIIFGFAQQAAKLPESKGVPKSERSQISNQTSRADENKNEVPNVSVSSNTLSQDIHTAQTDENIRIQGKLVTFTGLLVLVGFLQVAVVIWQACIYKRQERIMAEQLALTQPRLHIEGVRPIEFEPGRMPIFFIKIRNSGMVGADKVSVRMIFTLDDSAVEYSHDQILTIPANDARECFIHSRTMLTETTIRRLNANEIVLRISGSVIWEGKTIEYCYKYNRWGFDEPRPIDFPLFVACNFDTSVSIAVGLRPDTYGISGSDATMNVAPEPPEGPNKPT
jgi:hypothetical protein